MLIWCSNKVQPGSLLSERTSGVSPVIFIYATTMITSLTKFAQVEVKSFDIRLSASSRLSVNRLDDGCGSINKLFFSPIMMHFINVFSCFTAAYLHFHLLLEV